jgi:homoserine O-acetyltransferase
MATELTDSDSVRSSKPLKYVRTATFERPLELELGGTLDRVTVAYETYGTLDATSSNVVLICHALTGDSHAARHNESDDPGWWDIAVGPGKAIDTDKYFVVCPNILGGCRGTTGPNSINPATLRPYGADFPTITIGDMVSVQRMLLDHLGAATLLAVVGGSMGGHQVLAWATKFPKYLRGAIAIATSPRLTSQALAFDVVGRNAIMQDPNFQGGQYYGNGGPNIGLAIARMIGHITYLSPQAMQEKFETNRLQPRDVPTEFEKKFSVGSYLGYQGDKFVDRFDANSYIRLTMAMDLFDMGGTVDDLAAAFWPAQCRWLVVSYTSDWLFPPAQSQEIVNALVADNKPVSYCNVVSDCGHDAFLLPDEIDCYGELIRAFLANVDGGAGSSPGVDLASDAPAPTSIFQPKRLDYDRIVELVPNAANILDLGCGRGSLLWRLKRGGHKRLVGVELDEKAIVACVRRGLNVIQADLNRGIGMFDDDQFDVVVLSQTLQAVKDVEGVLREMLRVGRECIVSFPNFGYKKLRNMLAANGKAPESTGQLRYKWYNTPNIRFFSIADFEDFCRDKNIKIHRRLALDTECGQEILDDPNLNADMAIVVISK